jgi:eukaryotic-like serine/threonine-protein kinase
MSQAADALVGAVLDGSYRIEGMLGEGGMGAVYHATQLRLDKPVAIKVMARELGAAPEALARFHREALVTSNLGHPNIVQVFDLSTTPTGEPFLVMELLAGEDLEHRLRREGRLPPAAVFHIIKQVGAALMATHSKGIVHRDLKPANIYLLEAEGAGDFVKVLDFGISKVRSATTKLTRTASIMGTPGYMSPEQAKGRVEDIDEKTDQWALACIVWECLTGEPPFQGDSPLSTLFQVVNEPPPPLLPKVPGLHPKVEDVLLRALCKRKDDRFASVSDFVVALEEAATGAAAGPRPVSQTMRYSQTAVDAAPAARPIQPTTFTRTAGELDDADLLRARSRAWIWAAAGAAALLVVGAILLLRPSPAPQPTTVASPPAAPAPEPPPAPEPVQMPEAPAAEPPPAPPAAKVAEDGSAKPGPTPRAPEKKKRVRAAAPTEPKGAKPARRPAVPRMIEDL